MGWFNFLKTPANRGVGTGNLALEQTQSNPVQSMYGPRYNVERSLAPTRQGGAMKVAQNVPIVPIEGNGAYLAGVMALQNLIDTSKRKES